MSKIHARCDNKGLPVGFIPTGGRLPTTPLPTR